LFVIRLVSGSECAQGEREKQKAVNNESKEINFWVLISSSFSSSPYFSPNSLIATPF
jgi:hypothetical protein